VNTQGRPTLETVARAAGVSPMTVSNAYNRPDQLSQQTRAMVLAVAKDLGYPGPDPAGRSLRRRRADTVGVLLTAQLPYAFTDPGLVAFLHGLATGLADAGQALLLVPTEGNAEHAHVRNALVDGFVLASLAADDPVVADVLARRLPVVTWGQPRIPGVPGIGVDNARAAAKAAHHLLELGHASFGIVTIGAAQPPGSPAVSSGVHRALRARVSGFLRALQTAGIDSQQVRFVDAARNARPDGAAAARTMLTARTMLADRRPTAIFAVTDVLALGVLDGAKDCGVDVPAQLSVVGFDDVAAAASSVPPLTTVSQSLFDQGRLAASVVLDEVAGRAVKIPPIRSKLIVRGTTAAQPN
jgi:DNA-binding LacI/PurR family transcriptional regulator